MHNELKPLPPTDLYCIDVPDDAKGFYLNEPMNRVCLKYRHYKLGHCLDNIEIPKGNWKILGTVTKEEISFDCEAHIDGNNGGIHDTMWRDYTMKDLLGNFQCQTASESFRSLLTSNGICFEKGYKKLILRKK